ncbi:MAG: hypothetical protein RLO81_11975 [Fulvivirga sp.]|uniref:hypothetical protein n=1 Tax=Fulvivirga sp. TaxID=1931237 RepID=UPI0032EB6045
MNFKKFTTYLAIVTAVACTACSQSSESIEEEFTTDNMLLKEWSGPYGGLPAFDQMNLDSLKPALTEGMRLNLKEIDKIANNTEPATFENTIVALESAGDELNRVFVYYGIWSSNMSTPEFREIQAEMAPIISEFSSKITQNEKLFQRIKTVYEQTQKEPRSPEEQRLVQLTYEGYAMNGADLDEESKKRYAEINKELSSLYTTFASNVLADEESYETFLNKDQLGGLSESYINSAAKAAADRGKEGMYAVVNTRSSMDPFLTYSTERDLREKVWRNYYSRGDNGGEHDNNQIIADI